MPRVSQLPAKVFGQDQLYDHHQPYLEFDMSGRGHILAASEMHVFRAVKDITLFREQQKGDGGSRLNKRRRLHSWVCWSLLP